MQPDHNAAQWDLPEIEQLLERGPLRLETGIARNAAGQLVVAMRTDMHGCKGRMLDWWFKYFETTEHIKWWHPHDHVEHRGWDSKWKKGESYIGASIHAVESLADIPPVAAKLKFHAPDEAFDPARLKAAFAQNDVSAAVYARIGFGDHVQLDADGDPLDGHMLHIATDTPYGCVLRSRFLLGMSAKQPLEELPDHLGLALMRHCYTEFTYLSRFLPSLYYGEHANGELAPLPW